MTLSLTDINVGSGADTGDGDTARTAGQTINANNAAIETAVNALTATPEGTAILSTGETGGNKFLREDGDGTCSWQTVAVEVSSDTTPQLGGQLDVNGNALGDGTLELLTFTETASAVNHINITNAATGNGAIIGTAGDDAAVDLKLDTKGSGKIIAESTLQLNGYTIQQVDDDTTMTLCGGNSTSTGARLRLYGASHATAAGSFGLFDDANFVIYYSSQLGKISLLYDTEIQAGDELRTDTISETTSANGVVVDSVTLKDGGVQGAGGILLTERADHQNTPGATKGELWVRSDTPNVLVFTDDAGTDWDLNTAGGAGDFLADGSVDMTGEFRTDVGTMDSDVADGATANAWDFDCANTLSTAGANVFRMRNAGTPVFDFSFQGGIDHVNSGANAGHSQSLNLNWITNNAAQTSSGQYSAVIGGYNTASGQNGFAAGYANTASGQYSIALGASNTASQVASVALGSTNTSSDIGAAAVGSLNSAAGRGSVALGTYAKTTLRGSIAFASGRISATGDAQSLLFVPIGSTTDATQTTLLMDGSTALTIPADTTWAFSALVVGRSDETDGNDSGAYRIEGCLTRDESNNTALVGSVTVTTIAESAGASAWSVTAEADDTNEALAIKVTGEAATNIRWVAKVDIAQVTYA